MPTSTYISQRVVFPGAVRPAAILIDTDSGRIQQIASADAPPAADFIHDLGNDALLPGLIDPHVHINDPGRAEWEGFATATRAAAAGGVTTLIDMPLNCLPETTTVAALEQKRQAAAGQTHTDWRPWGGAVNGNAAHLIPLAQAGVPGFKCFLIYPGCDGLGLIDERHLHEAMPLIARTGLPLLVHAELAGPLETAADSLLKADWRQYRTYFASRPDQAETDAVALMIGLVRRYGTRVHIVHVSSAEALPLIAAAKRESLPVTAETCPHYLYLHAEEIPDSATEFKCAPPIRSEANRQRLWQGLLDGTLDLIATDHSPCPPAMKNMPTHGGDGSFQTAWGGIASLSLGLSATWTALQNLPQTIRAPFITEPHPAMSGSTTDHNLLHIARWMSQAPAQLAGLNHRKGRIEEGHDADLVVFSPEAGFTVTPDCLHFRHPVSPYLGRTLQGVVRQTILRGVPVYADGTFPNQGHGREVTP